MSIFPNLPDDVLQQLGRLDVVVPTYNRQDYALRLMRYWSGTGVRVFVLDGSADPIAIEALADLGSESVYMHRPVSYQKRLHEAAGLATREYVMMMSDDELYLPSAVASAIDHLDDHPKQWAATGRVIRFYSKKNRVIGQEWYTGYDNYGDDALRLNQVDRTFQYEVPHYAMLGVTRGDHWRDLWEIVYRHDYTCPYAYEAMFHMTAPYIGITWVIDELLWLRSSETDENVLPSWNRRMPFHEWYDQDTFMHERKLWEQSVADIVAHFAEGSMSENQVLEVARFIINRQVAGSRPKTYTWTPGQRLHRFFRRLTPQMLRTAMKSLLPPQLLAKLGYVGQPLPEIAQDLQVRGVRVDLAQLERTVDFVRDFHAVRQR
jgi:glycosyltransferase domain-containing protein